MTIKHFLIINLILASHISFSQNINTILWQINDTVSDKTSYLVGTFHTFGNSFVDSLPELENALKKSELAIFESIDDDDGATKVINARTHLDGVSIIKKLKGDELENLKQITQEWHVDINHLTPTELRWFLQSEYARTLCRTAASRDEWDHFDDYLLHLAKLNGKEVYGLENDSLQLELIQKEHNNIGWRNDRKIIRYYINALANGHLNEGDCYYAEMYRTFDLDYELNQACDDRVLIKQRNSNWMKIIPDLLKQKNCFVVVGLSHLKQSCGLISQLRESGFLVEPVELKKAGSLLIMW